jgi:hypothetical protein
MSTAWWVNQGTTFDQDRQGGYVWAPIQTKAGHPVAHHTNVNRLAPGDVVIHYVKGQIRSVGIVSANPEVRARPSELPTAWGDSGDWWASS